MTDVSTQRMPRWLLARTRYFALAVGTIALGLTVHWRGGALSPVGRDVLGDALWAAMVVWWIAAVAPAIRLPRLAALALVFCFAVEFSQLVRLPALDALRGTTAGHLALGSGFDPRDFLSYATGVLAAVLLERATKRRRSGKPASVRPRAADAANRVEIAQSVQQYLSGALSFDRLRELVPAGTDDEEVAELLDLIVHEPKQGGFMGAGPEEYGRHVGRIRDLVDLLACPPIRSQEVGTNVLVYVKLLDEDVEVWRPVTAEPHGRRLLSDHRRPTRRRAVGVRGGYVGSL